MKLFPHQEAAVAKMHNGCVLTGDTGTGKSVTAIDYYFHKACGGTDVATRTMRTPRDLIIITTAKKRDSYDWEKDAAHYGIFSDRENHPQGVNVRVDSWNNIAKYTEVSGAFFIFDEQRLVGSGVWTRAFVKIAKHNEWVLLSATPGDNWLDYIPVFLAHGFYKNRTEFKREHCIYNSYAKFPKVERYVGTGKLVKQRNAILVEMPYLRHTIRHVHEVEVSYDESTFEKVSKGRWHVYEQRPLRDVAELFAVMRKVVNSDTSRLTAVQTLMTSHPKLIVFYNFNYELEQLRTLSPGSTSTTSSLTSNESEQPTIKNGESDSYLQNNSVDSSQSWAIAEWNGHKHEPIPTTDRWVYLVQYVAGSEGWNCIETDAMCFYSLTYSYKNFHQAHGRIDRLNTPFTHLHYYILRSQSLIDKAVMKSLRAKKSFNERKSGLFST